MAAIALRGGLLHDIGKAVTAEVEGPHAIIGGDIANVVEKIHVVNAIAAHHEEVPFNSIYASNCGDCRYYFCITSRSSS